MLSVSSFIELCQRSDVRVLFSTVAYQFTDGLFTKKVAKEHQPEMSDVRYPIAMTLSGYKLGVCTDHTYQKYFEKTFCLYLPFTVEEYCYYLSLVAKVYGWFMPDAPIHPFYPVNIKPSNVLNNSLLTRGYIGVVQNNRETFFKPISSLRQKPSGICPLILHHRNRGSLCEIATSITRQETMDFMDGTADSALGVMARDRQERYIPAIFSSEANELVHKSPVFEVIYHSDSGKNIDRGTIRTMGLIPIHANRQRKILMGKVRSSTDGSFFLFDPESVTDRQRSLMKLYGFNNYSVEGLKAFLPTVTWDDTITSHTEWFKTLLEFVVDRIGVDDMHLSDPLYYAGQIGELCTGSPEAHGRRWQHRPLRGSRNFRHYVKNKKIMDVLENSLKQNNS